MGISLDLVDLFGFSTLARRLEIDRQALVPVVDFDVTVLFTWAALGMKNILLPVYSKGPC